MSRDIVVTDKVWSLHKWTYHGKRDFYTQANFEAIIFKIKENSAIELCNDLKWNSGTSSL